MYDLGRLRGRLTAEAVTYLEVNGGRIYAAGTGRWNGLPGRGWCVVARDRGEAGDWLEVRIYKPGDAHFGSCRQPVWTFMGNVESGDIRARPEG
jgi:hypothetical protein